MPTPPTTQTGAAAHAELLPTAVATASSPRDRPPAAKLPSLRECCREIAKLERSSGQEGAAFAGLLEDCERLVAAIDQQRPAPTIDPDYRDEYSALLEDSRLQKRCRAVLGEYIQK